MNANTTPTPYTSKYVGGVTGWTVGRYNEFGTWRQESTHPDGFSAADQVAHLNGYAMDSTTELQLSHLANAAEESPRDTQSEQARIMAALLWHMHPDYDGTMFLMLPDAKRNVLIDIALISVSASQSARHR